MQNVIPTERSLVKCAYCRAARKKKIYNSLIKYHWLVSSLSSGLNMKGDSNLHDSPIPFLTSVQSLIILTMQSYPLLNSPWDITSSVNVPSYTSALNLSSDPNQHHVCTISLKHCCLWKWQNHRRKSLLTLLLCYLLSKKYASFHRGFERQCLNFKCYQQC